MRKLGDAKRSEIIAGWFTNEEKERGIRAALDRGLAPSQLVRQAALNLLSDKEARIA